MPDHTARPSETVPEPVGCGLRGLFWEYGQLPHPTNLSSFPDISWPRLPGLQSPALPLSQACEGWGWGETASFQEASEPMPPAP